MSPRIVYLKLPHTRGDFVAQGRPETLGWREFLLHNYSLQCFRSSICDVEKLKVELQAAYLVKVAS